MLKRNGQFLLIIFLIFCWACGRKLDVKPPYAVRPKPPSDLHLILRPWGVELIFKPPNKRIDGSRLNRLKGFQIVRFSEKINEKGRIIKDVFYVQFKDGMKEIHFRDQTLVSGFRYYYEIRAVSGWHCISDPLISTSFAWHTPPSAPNNLVAQAGDTFVALKWHKVRSFLDKSPISKKLRYRIFRIEKNVTTVIADLVEKTSYLDKQVQNERLYCYKVAAIFEYFGSLIQGPLSNKACARPVDLTPPRPPEGLTAIYLKGGVLLRWHWNTELDLAGYRVYRYCHGSQPKLLNKKLLKEPKFFDKDISAPGLYYYWVTAVDSSPRANESLPSKKVEIEILSGEE